MFSNFIRFDLKNGLLKAWKKYVIALFVFSCFFSFHFFRVYAQNIRLQKSGETPLRFTCGDLLLSVLGGMKEFHYEDGEPFLFPALWIFVFLLLLYFTLRYPSENLGGIGQKHVNLVTAPQNMVSFKMRVVCQFCAYIFRCTLSHRFSHLHLPRRRSHFTTKRIRSCYTKRRHISQSPSVEYPPRAFPHSLHGLQHRSTPNAFHLFHASHFQLYYFLCPTALFCLFCIPISSRKLSYVLQNRDFLRKWTVYFPWLLHRFFHDRSKLCYRLPANRTNGYTRKRIRRFYF